MINFTNEQARRFMLLKQGLIGEHRFSGKQGVLDFIRQASAIQFDPVDICGKNAELTLQSRVKDFTKSMLDELLYHDRKLYDNYDKCLCIIPIEDWPYFSRARKNAQESGLQSELCGSVEELTKLEEQTRVYIANNGIINSGDLRLSGQMRSSSGFTGNSNVTQVVLNQMYYTGEVIIHHKVGTRKYYDLTRKLLPSELLNAPDPIPDDKMYLKWRILRRIGAMGLLWNRASDAWLGLRSLKNDNRTELFKNLTDTGEVIPITVDGIKDPLYCRFEDLPLIEIISKNSDLLPRCELIAPLDPFIWDRKLIKTLFAFEYTWEIYVQPHKRKYGAYVLPLLYGDSFVGRVEAIVERKVKTLVIKNIWYEEEVKLTTKMQNAIRECIQRFALFNNCDIVQYQNI